MSRKKIHSANFGRGSRVTLPSMQKDWMRLPRTHPVLVRRRLCEEPPWATPPISLLYGLGMRVVYSGDYLPILSIFLKSTRAVLHKRSRLREKYPRSRVRPARQCWQVRIGSGAKERAARLCSAVSLHSANKARHQKDPCRSESVEDFMRRSLLNRGPKGCARPCRQPLEFTYLV